MLRRFVIAAAAALMAAPVVLPAATKPAVMPEEGALIGSGSLETLKDVREMAYEAANRAAALQSLGWTVQSSAFSHGQQLEELRGGINEMGAKLGQLERERDTLSPAGREIVDRATRMLRSMAENTAAAMHYLKDSPKALFVSTYRKYLDNLAEESENLSHLVGQFVELSSLRAKEQYLRQSLASAVNE